MYPAPSTTRRAVLLLRDKPVEDPTSEHLFVFGNAARNRIKILFSDASGIWLCGKRHARDRSRWKPREEARDAGAKACLSPAELSMLLHGLSQMPGGARSAACLFLGLFQHPGQPPERKRCR
jgi:transposase